MPGALGPFFPTCTVCAGNLAGGGIAWLPRRALPSRTPPTGARLHQADDGPHHLAAWTPPPARTAEAAVQVVILQDPDGHEVRGREPHHGGQEEGKGAGAAAGPQQWLGRQALPSPPPLSSSPLPRLPAHKTRTVQDHVGRFGSFANLSPLLPAYHCSCCPTPPFPLSPRPPAPKICFVGDEGFRDLSRIDPEAPRLLAEAVAKDKSGAWFERRAQQEKEWAAKGL